MNTCIKIILYSFLFFVLIHSTHVYADSTLFITKPTQMVSVGDTFTIDIKVKSTDKSINAVSGTILFPADMVRMTSISRDNSILNIWTHDPSIQRNQLSFEGVILNPGYQGANGQILRVTFEAKRSGVVTLNFKNGSILANDGLGTNIVASLSPTNFTILRAGVLSTIPKPIVMETQKATTPSRPLALPVITEYPLSIYSKDSFYLKGKGEPNALTKLAFEEISQKSFGEQFLDFVQSKKRRITDVFVKNDKKGEFEYQSQSNLLAGAYNATPFLVDDTTNSNKTGLGVQLIVKDNKIIKALIVFINILILLIPIIGLIVLIYFIPWYSSRRIRILKRKMGLEEEKIEITEHQLQREDRMLSREASSTSDSVSPEKNL